MALGRAEYPHNLPRLGRDQDRGKQRDLRVGLWVSTLKASYPMLFPAIRVSWVDSA
jgi:hypothetical protein